MAAGAADEDAQLVDRARRGGRDAPGALEALVRRHDRWVRGVVYTTLGRPGAVDDVVQQIWINVCSQIGTLADPTRWRGWLFRLARNAAIDAGQRSTRERQLFRVLPAEADVAHAEPGSPEALAESEEHERVMRAIQGLPAIYREPFVLRHLEEWNYQQIGEALGLPLDTVETRLVRARRLLRESLRPSGADDER
ncbi:MAG: RNA polymerase sigma factor [Phycisphaerae bacterium]